MAETSTGATDVASQYSAQVASDLERNLKEQERLSGEIEALQAQLTALQHNQSVLASIQLALGTSAEAPAPAPAPVTAVPAPRKKTAARPGTGRQSKAQKPAAAAKKRPGKKSTTAQATTSQPAAPKLVALVREHLADQREPRSAAEVATALEKQHPERTIKTNVVRTTLEGLVAKNQAQRSKQGSSVFYTSASAAAEPDAPAQDAPSAGDE
jgi:predicted  nucleic acid-binding Zn-ribbon protein